MEQDEAGWLALLMQREPWITFAYPLSDASRKSYTIHCGQRETPTLLRVKTPRVWAQMKLTGAQGLPQG